MSILANRCLRRAHLVEELLEDWQIKHTKTMLTSDLGELVQECLELRDLVVQTWGRILDRLFDGKIVEIDATGNTMKLVLEKSLSVFRKTAELIEETKPYTGKIQGFDEIPGAVSRIAELRADLFKKWPSVNHEMIRESTAAYERGEYQFAKDMLDGLENSCAKAD